ncbi:hypothetical protein [Desulfosporosinus youngiae]|uniref:Uncharacterized protein n=1 Tax=Desulfosporosinus youngiae DSM 17734 TaxID=768710 RepID=H5Y2P9_9FIRM|nr:hypothetical protein [Desulfosporosinus youngiae]EHQ88312.1 hypothetical protein DesyoDRAFT_1142 [Desulfosporosinus youngiae DSM 17734]
MRRSIVKKSILSIVMVIMCVFMTSTPALAVTDYVYLQIPSYQTTPSNPGVAWVDGDTHLVGFRFAGACPAMYHIAVSEVDSAGNHIPGYFYWTGHITITPDSPEYLGGGTIMYLPTAGLIKNHIYRVQLQSVYYEPTFSTFDSFGYFKF